MSKLYRGLMVIILLTFAWVIPVCAAVMEPNQALQPVQAVQPISANQVLESVLTQQLTVSSAGGVQPISPDKLKQKLEALENWAVTIMAPVMHLMSKLSLIIAVLLIMTAVFARQLMGRAFMIIGCVIIGMAIFTNVSSITDTILWLGYWLGQ